MNYYNFINNMKADSCISLLKKLNFETLENNDIYFYDFIKKTKDSNKLNIRYKI